MFSRASLETFTRVAGGLTLLAGLSGVLIWAVGPAAHSTPLSSVPPIRAQSAASLVLLGAALLLLAPARTTRAARLAGRGLSLLVAVVALATLGEYAFDAGQRILASLGDELVASANARPHRMGFMAGLGFAFVGAGLPLLDVRTRRGAYPSEWLALAAGATGLTVVVGHVYSSPLLRSTDSSASTRLLTALALIILSAGLLAARPDRGLIAVATSPGPGGQALRRLMPAVLVVPFAMGWVSLLGQHANVYEKEVGWALFSTASMVVLALLVYWSSAGIERSQAERRRSDEALARSEGRYRALFMDTPSANYVSTPDGRLTACNRSFAVLLGFESIDEALAADLSAFYPHAAERAAFVDLVRTRKRLEYHEATVKRRNGQLVQVIETAVGTFDERGTLVGITGFLIDVTERKQLEEQLRVSQRLEAVGRLAGGVAHDFNNELTAILGYAEELLDEVPAAIPSRASVEEIRLASLRAADLTRQLLAFGRRQILKPVVMDLDEVVRELDGLVRRLIGEDVAVRTRLAGNLAPVRADRSQIEHALMNLVVNARDAMPGGGRLTIETAEVVLGEDFASTHGPVAPGRYVTLAVSDTGIGMDAATRDRVFEPFFTTKAPDKGSGLGLSSVYGVVRQSGGYVSVSSEPGRGSTFRIYLPAVDAPVERRAARPESRVLVGGETILLVEDEEGVRQLATRVLTRHGYRVLTARDADEAFHLAETRAGPIDLILTDVVMPRMDGREMAERLRQRLPHAAVLFMSGYTSNAIQHYGVLDAGVELLEKPFTPQELAGRVREVLDARR